MHKLKLVFLTGAGVSAESGVKTFRDHDGLWEGNDVMEVASIEGWRRDREKVLRFYNQRRAQLKEVQPNAAHYSIASLEENYEVHVITQNVDDLHERAGSTNILHLHGELVKMCSSMNKELTLPYDEDIKIGDKHPDGSQLRPYIVWFGEDVPLLDDAIKIVRTADILVVLGTSLQVYPAASLARYTPADCRLFYIDPKPADDPMVQYFTVIKEPATTGMEKLKEII